MSNYELTFLVEDTKSCKQLQEILESFDGKKIDEKPWGKRLLAYPIDKKTSAEYFTWEIEIPRDKLADLKKKMNYENVVMRYLFLLNDREE